MVLTGQLLRLLPFSNNFYEVPYNHLLADNKVKVYLSIRPRNV